MTCLTSCEGSFRARVGGSRIQPGFPATGPQTAPQRTLSPKRLSPSTRSAQSAAPLETLDPPAPLNPLFVSCLVSTHWCNLLERSTLLFNIGRLSGSQGTCLQDARRAAAATSQLHPSQNLNSKGSSLQPCRADSATATTTALVSAASRAQRSSGAPPLRTRATHAANSSH